MLNNNELLHRAFGRPLRNRLDEQNDSRIVKYLVRSNIFLHPSTITHLMVFTRSSWLLIDGRLVQSFTQLYRLSVWSQGNKDIKGGEPASLIKKQGSITAGSEPFQNIESIDLKNA